MMLASETSLTAEKWYSHLESKIFKRLDPEAAGDTAIYLSLIKNYTDQQSMALWHAEVAHMSHLVW